MTSGALEVDPTSMRWAQTVTTALLGTDRRAIDDTSLPTAVLAHAARHRILARLAAPVTVTDTPEPAPPQNRPEAPDRADQLLGALLRIPDPALVSTWLAVCSEHGRSVAAVRWTKLARLAARSTAYDRPMLGAALGARGRWFLGQNPEWRRLAADVEAATSTRVTRAGDQPALTVDDVLAEPERLLDQPQPWRAELVAAAYAVLGGAGRAVPAPSFASRLGVALPAALYPSIAAAGEYYLLAPDASPARRRAVRERFVALECAAYAGAQIERSFSDHARDVVRVEVPHV